GARDRCRLLTRKSFEGLEPGGRVILHEMLYDDRKTGPFSTAAMNINMLLQYEAARQYSRRELSAMLEQAGFSDIEVKPTFGYYSIVIGHKPGRTVEAEGPRWLPAHSFDHADEGWRRGDRRQFEAGAGQQRPVVALGALAAAQVHEHEQVEELAERRIVARREDQLDHEQAAVFGHRPVAVPEDRPGALVVPIVDYPLQ